MARQAVVVGYTSANCKVPHMQHQHPICLASCIVELCRRITGLALLHFPDAMFSSMARKVPCFGQAKPLSTVTRQHGIRTDEPGVSTTYASFCCLYRCIGVMTNFPSWKMQ